METQEQKTCQQRVKENMDGRVSDLRTLLDLYRKDPEANDEELGNFNEYGLAFDYVLASTFDDQEEGYFRYQLSWGGPSDEFRFFTDAEFNCYKIEYWFLDWYDGARLPLYGENRLLLLDIFSDFKDCGTLEHVFKKAME